MPHFAGTGRDYRSTGNRMKRRNLSVGISSPPADFERLDNYGGYDDHYSEEELEPHVVRRTVVNLACAQEKKHDPKEGAQVGLSSG